jgi:signal transduction histidine kinase
MVRGLRRDLLIAGAAYVVGAGMLVVAHGMPRQLSAWSLVPLAVACAGLAFRRSRPLLALAIGSVAVVADQFVPREIDQLSLVTPLVYSQILYDACLYGSRTLARWLLRVSVVATLGAVGAGLIWLPGTGAALLGIVVAAFTVLPAITGFEVRHHREQAEAERLRAEQVARLAELDHRNAVAAERTRMARELHDVVANHLSAIAVQSTAALAVGGDESERALTVIRENSVQGLEEMRRMIGLLRSDDADPVTTAPRLDELSPLLDQAGESGVDARVRIDGEPRSLPAAVDLAAYRIVQEALTNVVKHAAPGRADVTIAYRPDRVAVSVENPLPQRLNGVHVPGSGTGLVGMGERAALLDGTFRAGPRDGAWQVYVDLPTGEPR